MIYYDVYNETRTRDERGEELCTYNNLGPCLAYGTGYSILSCIILFIALIICLVLYECSYNCRQDLTESFDAAQTMTDVYVDKLNKDAEKKIY